MNELEITKRIEKFLLEMYNVTEIDHILLEFDDLKQALATPTSKEVCDMLINYLREGIFYKKECRSFEAEDNYWICQLVGDIVIFNEEIKEGFEIEGYPPKILLAISKFYAKEVE